jgi:hypothetical protein
MDAPPGAAREPTADRPPLDRLPRVGPLGQPLRDRRDRHDHERRPDADAGDSLGAAATCRNRTCGRCSGLGDAGGPVSVEVRMPGGARWSWQDLAVDRLHCSS